MTYGEYLGLKDKPKLNVDEKKIEDRKMVLKTEISELIGKISLEKDEDNKKELDKKYQEKLRELRHLG
jgi:hypothetical protein